ncbi:putative DNA-binding protein with PD1-like motif [Rhizobium sp. PP-F2F-G48]|nr:putative DNA-binding protein with PD1-like motif [Rhizobium sp. PP-F2F-G48]
MTMRHNHQPGTAFTPRTLSLGCHAEPIQLTFQPGTSVLAAIDEALAARGFQSAVIEVTQGAFLPLVYVTPIIPADGLHAAWYSDTHAPSGRAEIERLTIVFGRRDGQPFLHCHGVWQHADGYRGAGHLMPSDAQFAEPVDATVWGISGAIMDQLDDSETRFRLFTPLPHAEAPPIAPRRAVLCRLKPNEPLHRAIEAIAASHGIVRASLHGIGSLIGCTFQSGETMTAAASELLIRSGRLAPDAAGDTRVALDLMIVDPDRRIFEGAIVEGADPVCITFELLIVEEDD